MPRECPLAFRSVPAVAGIGSTKRRSVRPPIAIAPVRCHVRCGASRAKAPCGGRADLGELSQRHNHGPQYALGAMARSSLLSLQAWDGVNQGEGLLRVVTIGSGQLNSERNPATVADQMTFAAELGPVGWIRTCLRPPSLSNHFKSGQPLSVQNRPMEGAEDINVLPRQ